MRPAASLADLATATGFYRLTDAEAKHRSLVAASKKGGMAKPAAAGAAMSFNRASPVTTVGQVPLRTGCARLLSGATDASGLSHYNAAFSHGGGSL
jgi:hypothetical protein